MKEVTDPTIIAQLDQLSGQSQGREVTDPNVIAQLDRMEKINKFSQALGIDQPSAGQNIMAGILNGIKDSFSLTPDLTKVVSESKNIFPSVDPYKLMGTTNQPLNTAAGLEQAAGEFGPAVLVGGNLIKNGIQSALRGRGNLINSIVENYKTATKTPIIHELPEGEFPKSPHMASRIFQYLGNGSQNMEENATSLANDIMQAHNYHENVARSLINPPLEELKEQPLYEKFDPFISTKMNKAQDLIDKMDEKKLRIGPLYDQFKNNMNVYNAHQLQSEMGTMIGDLKNSNLSVEDRVKLNDLKAARDKIKEDIINKFEREDAKDGRNRAESYKKGIDYYRNNVAPYLSSQPLREIVREGVMTPDNIHKVFKSPSDITNRYTGEVKIGPINKIIEDLPEEAKNKILFSKINAMKYENDPKSLYDSLKEAKNNGYSTYFTHQVGQAMRNLSDQLRQESSHEAALKIARSQIKNINSENIARQKEAKANLFKLGAKGISKVGVAGTGTTYLAKKLLENSKNGT